MHRDEWNSGIASAETSKTPATPPAPEKTSSEQAYLTRQAADARRAARHVLRDLGRDALHDLDPRTWMRSHPWATVGSIGAAACIAAAIVMSSKNDGAHSQAADDKASSKRRETGNSNGDAPLPDADDPDGKSFASLLWRVSGHFLRIFEPVIASMLASMVAAWTTPAQVPNAEPATSYGPDNAPPAQ